MDQIHTRIGEHTIRIESDSAKMLTMFGRNYRILAFADGSPDISVRIEEGYGVSFKDYQVEIVREPEKVCFRRADYLIAADLSFKRATISVHDDLALKHALINLYSSYIVHHDWGLLIHSSCVEDEGKAHLFAGHSGAGKSTAAKLSFPRELLSDEATIVRITSGEAAVFNSPFRSELEAKAEVKGWGRPLASIQILNQSLDNQRTRLAKSDGLLRMMDKVFYWPHSPQEAGKILVLLKGLAAAVPIYELHFQKNNSFWELIS